jgi:multiple sugar transport system substrate-binding protein
MTALFTESETAEVFTWDPSANNRFFVSGRGSIIQNAISAIRTAEKQAPDVAKNTALAPPAAGPKARLGSEHLMNCYVVWKFAENPERRTWSTWSPLTTTPSWRASSQLPSFSKSVTDQGKLAADKHNPRRTWSSATPKWRTGYPGYTTAAIDEAFNTFVIPNMLKRVARGEQGPGARQAGRGRDEAPRRQVRSGRRAGGARVAARAASP